MTHPKLDVAVIGGGIMGLAHGWMASRQGLRVGLFERNPAAAGASIRNFGMVWPIGQTAGERYETALRSRDLWLELAQRGVIEASECGSVHLAHHDDEWRVLQEFAALGQHSCHLLNAAETLRKAPIANPDGLRGGLWSPTELRVNPRIVNRQIAHWLATEFGVGVHFQTPVIDVRSGQLTTSTGRTWTADKIIVCSGSDLRSLYPRQFAASGLKLCKLQMLQTRRYTDLPQDAHIASGLTLRHYTSFEDCPSLPELKQRVADENPLLDQYGIHVMATRRSTGELTLGDSHEYDEDITAFDKSEIDDLIVSELQKILVLPDWAITERWHGIYAKHPTDAVYVDSPEPGVHLCVGPGGAGMTMSFGLASQLWNEWS